MARLQLKTIPDNPELIVLFINGKQLFGTYHKQADDVLEDPDFQNMNPVQRQNALHIAQLIYHPAVVDLYQSFSANIDYTKPYALN